MTCNYPYFADFVFSIFYLLFFFFFTHVSTIQTSMWKKHIQVIFERESLQMTTRGAVEHAFNYKIIMSWFLSSFELNYY